MSNKLADKQAKSESGWAIARRCCGYLLDGLISIYMLMIIVVMPFYNEEGFSHIGTDKAVFFRQASGYGVKLIAPVLILWLILGLAAYLKEKSGEKTFGRPAGKRCKRSGAKAARTKEIRRNPGGPTDKTGYGGTSGQEPTGSRSITGLFRSKLSITDAFALLYGVSLLLSYLCSDYKEQALWGATGWYMGLLPQLLLLAIYFLVSRFWRPKKWMAVLFLPVSGVVFLLGYLNRFGIFPIDMRLNLPGFISTIGNINWYCGYLVSVFFGGYYLLWRTDETEPEDTTGRVKKGLLAAYVAVGFATLVTQGSRSGIFALMAVLLVTFCLSAKDGRRMRMFWAEILLLSMVCVMTLVIRRVFHGQITFTDAFTEILTNTVFPLVMAAVAVIFLAMLSYKEHHGGYPQALFCILKRMAWMGAAAGFCVIVGMIAINTLRPGSLGALSDMPFFTFSADWGSSRGASWRAGWMCFLQQDPLHKLIGTGPDCMSAFLYTNGSAELATMVKEIFGANILTNSHNEWLTVLVNTGVIGLTGFGGMIVSATVRFLKQRVCTGCNTDQETARNIVGACGLCLLAYTVNNIFSFQQSMNTATIFVILGMGEAYGSRGRFSQAEKKYSLCKDL